jgi:ribosomal protein S18 acetylase RimI-like enzyme
MTEDILEDKKPKQEKLDIKIKLATEENWQECQKLRLFSIKENPKAFGATPESIQEEEQKSEEEWRRESLSEYMFSVLAWNNQDAVGLGRARSVEGVWRVRNGYVKPEFRNIGIQQKMLALRLSEIIKRGGEKVVMGIEISNSISLHNAEKFGFKIAEVNNGWNMMELDLTDRVVIGKINEVLAGNF